MAVPEDFNRFNILLLNARWKCRSTTNIVNAAQKIISSDSARRKQSDLRQDMKPMRGAGPTPRVLACADAKAEGRLIVLFVQEIKVREIISYHSFSLCLFRVYSHFRRKDNTGHDCIGGLHTGQYRGHHLSHKRTIACLGRGMRTGKLALCDTGIVGLVLQTGRNPRLSLFPSAATQWP